jgi:ADP-heptose:LPS heptosyltransferase
MLYLLLTWLFAPWWWLSARCKHYAAPRRIAVIQTAKIGDMLCATPAISALKTRFPGAKLTVVHAPVTRALIERHPQVDATLAVDSKSWKGLAGKRALARRLSDGQFDMVLCLSPSLPILLAMCWARIPVRLSLLPTWRNRSYRWMAPLLSDVEWHQPGELVLNAVKLLLARQDVVMGAQKSMAEDATGEVVCEQLGLTVGPHAIGVAVSSANKLKELGEPKLLALIDGLLKCYPAPVVLLGGPEDSELAERLLKALPDRSRIIDATGRFKLDQLPALMRRLKLFIGVDSGLTYLADTFDVPIVSVVGPTDPREQRPLGAQVRFVVERPPCYPCAFVFKAPYRCHTGTRICIEAVGAERILAEVAELWRS